MNNNINISCIMDINIRSIMHCEWYIHKCCIKYCIMNDYGKIRYK